MSGPKRIILKGFEKKSKMSPLASMPVSSDSLGDKNTISPRHRHTEKHETQEITPMYGPMHVEGI